ncbi:hypothetical protein AB1I63_05995 [Streptococcus pneumoniae]
MLDELNLPLDQVMMLIVVTVILAGYLWRNLGYCQLDVKEKEQEKTQKAELSPDYGAYIQLGMRRSS